MLRIIVKAYHLFQGDRLGGVGFYPIPPFLKAYFQRMSKLRQILVYSRLVKGVSFWKQAPKEVACVESVTTILNVLFGYPILLGTWTLLERLKTDRSWMELRFPVNGCIVLAATGTGKPNTVGHVGVYDNRRVWSNSSASGKWGIHHTIQAFRYYYEVERGMKIRYFIPLEK